jgi:hypothetical protein
MSGVFHGTSNYALFTPDKPKPNAKNIKMRSYETGRIHTSISLNGEQLTENDRYGEANNPAIDFLSSLNENPRSVDRQPPFIKTGIVKIGDYTNRLDSYQDMGLEPGDTINKSGMLREFSLSQFTFKTYEQWKAWEKRHKGMKDKYGQSFEMFFLNEDGTLDYQAMIADVDNKIKSQPVGLEVKDYDPLTLYDNSRNRYRDLENKMGHPNFLIRIRLAELMKHEPL